MGDVVDMKVGVRANDASTPPARTGYVHDDGRHCLANGSGRWLIDQHEDAAGPMWTRSMVCGRPHSLAERLPHVAAALSADEADVARLERDLALTAEDQRLADQSSVADEAMALVYGDREDDYGHPRQSFTRTAQVWTALLGDKLEDGAFVTPEDVARLMVGFKLSRDVHAPKRDNVVDAIGYLVNRDRLETGR